MAEPVVADVTALVVTDPQNDFLSEKGVFWDAVKQSVIENDTIANIETMFQAAKEGGIPVFISLHYYYPWDHRWLFGGTIEAAMHEVGMYDRLRALPSSAKSESSRQLVFPKSGRLSFHSSRQLRSGRLARRWRGTQ